MRLYIAIAVHCVVLAMAAPIIRGGSRLLPSNPLWQIPRGTYITTTKELGVSCGAYCLQLELPSGQVVNAMYDKYSDSCENPTTYLKWDSQVVTARYKCGD